MCLAGCEPSQVRPTFFGASLCALIKKGGGVGPIAVGSIFRRLVAKAAFRSLTDKAIVKLKPRQLGFGVHLGAEAAVHAARVFLENLKSGQALLKVDFSNAFNTLRRDCMLSTVHIEIYRNYMIS